MSSLALPLFLLGCQAAPASLSPPALHVPFAALRGSEVPADYILPTNSLAEAYIPRGERVALAPPTAEFSAYTIYTYDAQPIGTPDGNGYGYRYRYVIQQGVTIP